MTGPRAPWLCRAFGHDWGSPLSGRALLTCKRCMAHFYLRQPREHGGDTTHAAAENQNTRPVGAKNGTS